MPIPKREKGEEAQKFMGRCMTDEVMKKEYPDQKQRVAICTGESRLSAEKGSLSVLVQEELVYSKFRSDAGSMKDYVFLSKEAAEKKAKEMGLKGSHSHQTGDNKTVWMPGKNMEEFNEWYKQKYGGVDK